MGEAYHKIYGYDLPVFVTTDAILHALHKSYDDILMDIEDTVITPKLKTALKTMYDKIPSLASQYSDNHQLDSALADIDLYVTIAYSLLDNTLRPTRICSATKEKDVWDAISALQMKEMQLFTNETVRKIDFSQFTPRGHYAPISTYDSHQPANYFRCMMWLGRIDFILTAPAGETGSWSREDLRRMACGALLMNELISISSVKNAIDEIDSLLTFLVGESDNLTPGELDIVRKSASITIPDLFDDQKYDHL